MSASSGDHPIWGEGVKWLRKAYGWSQTALAERAATTQATISRIELGSHEISDALRIRIARALKVDPHVLFPYREHDGNGNGNGSAA
jgi:transcriptional regulator with XRE-family HTH domain